MKTETQTYTAKTFISTIRLGYIRRIIQAQVLILLLYAATNPSAPIKALWHMDPLLGISALPYGIC